MAVNGPNDREVATLAGGCFWCLEPAFEEVRGVERVVPGYIGGTVPNPGYKQVCSGTTGHAEAVEITFNPQVVSFRELLDVFFTIHDPTTRNRQGADVGTQYRSATFYHSPEQQAVARQTIADLESQGIWHRPIVTEVTPYTVFYEAEPEHHDYYANNPDAGYCSIVISPKLAKLRTKHREMLKV